jgi:hypothetical protein
MARKISKLITYLSLLQETLKYKKNNPSLTTHYTDVDIELPDDFVIEEKWEGNEKGYSEQKFHTIEFPIKDIDGRIKTARDHLRYLKKRSNGHKHGE